MDINQNDSLNIIIDTDVDIDDWMAILYLINHPHVTVKGITVVGTGAAHLEPGTQNALDLLMLANRPEIPVAKGLTKPMQYDHQFPANIREPVDNLYGLTLPNNPNSPRPDAMEFLAETLENAADKLSILAIGPLTNLGALLQKRPELADRIEQVYIMAGAIDVPGNVNAADSTISNFSAEWNIYLDPVAAEIVFKSGASITLIPLDATNCVPLTKEFYLRILQNHNTPSAEFIYKALTQDIDFLMSGHFYAWDALAATLSTDEHIGAYQELNLMVDRSDGDNSGQIRRDAGGAQIKTCLRAEAPAFYDLFLNTLNGERAAKNSITFILNGEQITLENPSPTMLLVDYLHSSDVNYGGTKLVCGEGGCGACTVMLTSYDPEQDKLIKRPVNSCLRLLCTIDGMVVTTTEGIGSVKNELDPVQDTIAANNGSQCGYCTPGFVMNMYTLLQNQQDPTEKEIEDRFDGNICRCTGFRPILEGFKKFAKDYQPPEDPPRILIDPNFKPCVGKFKENNPPADFVGYMKHPQPIRLSERGFQYFRPVTLDEVYELKEKYGAASSNFKLVLGNTSIAILRTRPQYKEKGLNPQYLVDFSQVPELNRVEVDDDGITLGGTVTLARLIEVLESVIAERGETETKGLEALQEHIKVVANHQVRSVAGLMGNIYMAVNFGFLSDMIVVLKALGATLTVGSRKGNQDYPILEVPKTENLPKDAIYYAIHIPYTKANEYVDSYKIRPRQEDSHAIVNCGFRVGLDSANCVESICMVYNGVAADYDRDAAQYGSIPFRPITAAKTEGFLIGKPWTEETLRQALKCLSEEMDAYKPPLNAAGMPLEITQVPWSYRKSLTETLFYKFFVYVALQVNPGEVSATVKSAGETYERPLSYGKQEYNSYPEELPASEPLIKLSAFVQATGEAKFSHDMQPPPDTLEAAFVYSLIPRGKFSYKLPITTSWGQQGETIKGKQLNRFLREQFDGFAGYVCYEDIPEQGRPANWVGEGRDDPIFVPAKGDEIPHQVLSGANANFQPTEMACIGAPLGLAIATEQSTARDIATYIRNECIEFESLDAVVSFDQAIEEDHFFKDNPPSNPTLTHISDITRPGSNCDWLADPMQPFMENGTEYPVVHGSQRTGGQNHFYLETMATLAVPGENKTLTLYTSTQSLADNQYVAANVLGIPAANLRVVLKRDGGAFGGKQTRSRFNSTATAIAAYTLNKPVRLVLERTTNFIMYGERHPYIGDYHVAYDEDTGTIKGLCVNLKSDGGNTYDVSFPVMDLSQLNGDNSYNIDTWRTSGQVYRTNRISNTAFRSFGTVQSVNVIETAIDHVAHALGKRPEEIREKHLYRDGDYRWHTFKITGQTLGVLKAYGFSEETRNGLRPLLGILYSSEGEFKDAVQQVSDDFADSEKQNLVLLMEHSNTSYDFTPYLQGLKYCNIRSIWDGLKKSAEFDERVKAVEEFNAENRWRKRGIAMTPLKYGVSYTGPRGTLNQGGAYVIAYSDDGSVLVQHGGVESGQGIQTKMAQVAAATLDIPIEKIRMGDTDVSVISDASPTAASTGTDLNGGAVHQACLKLRKRLERFCEDLEQYTAYYAKFDPTEMDGGRKIQIDTVVRNWRERWSEVWEIIVSLAYVNRINLSDESRYKTPHYSAVDIAHSFGTPFFYYTYSVAVSEVEIDVLTGDFTILRADIVFDIGKSLNPLLDVGQIEGGFVQGVGNMTTEELLYQGNNEAPRAGYARGSLTSTGTWRYFPPGSKTIPIDFRVGLVDNTVPVHRHKGPKLDSAAVMSSKGCGESPLVMANSVFSAIRQAVLAARKDQGDDGWIQFEAPATIQRIQQACNVNASQLRLSDTGQHVQ
ncbi:MAG: molybdopterin cofactor-binding domain-containing protein [Dehalococcoidia bacterium]